MKQAFVSVMPKCFESWCGRFDEIFSRQIRDQVFRPYLGRVMRKSERTGHSGRKPSLDRIVQL